MKIDNISIMPVFDEGVVTGITIVTPPELTFDLSKINIQGNILKCIFTKKSDETE